MRTDRLLTFGSLALGFICAGCVAPPPPLVVPNCREFAQTITVDGKEQTGYGVECPQPDGTWKVVAPAVVPPAGTPSPPPAATYDYPPYYVMPYPYAYYPYQTYYPWYYPPVIQFGFGWNWGWHGHGGWHRPGGLHWHR